MSLNREPSVIIPAVSAVVSAAIKVAVLLGWVTWDADQLAGISLLVDAVLALASALLVRSVVTPVASPRLPEGTTVTTTSAGRVTGTTTV